MAKTIADQISGNGVVPDPPNSDPCHTSELLDTDGLVNEYVAARILGLQVTTLRRWRWAGKGPSFIKIGSAVRYEPQVLKDEIDAGRRNSTSERRGDGE